MKTVLTALLLLTSLSTFASTVVITPNRPVDCTVNNQASVNWIHSLEKVSENDDQVVFSFLTNYGSCIDKKIELLDIELTKLTVTLFHDGLNLPFEKKLVAINVNHYAANNEAKVELTFFKNRLFKKNNSRKFLMNFYPRASYKYSFDWTVRLTQAADNKVTLTFKK